MPEVKASFVDLRTLDQLVLVHNPDEIEDAKDVKGPNTSIPGRSHPKIHTGSGGLRTLDFTLRIARTLSDQPLSFVKDSVAWLQSLLYPYIDTNFEQHDWTAVQFKWGDLYDLPCIVRSANAKFPLFDYETALPEYADVALRLEEVTADSIDSPSVRTAGTSFIRFLTP